MGEMLLAGSEITVNATIHTIPLSTEQTTQQQQQQQQYNNTFTTVDLYFI